MLIKLENMSRTKVIIISVPRVPSSFLLGGPDLLSQLENDASLTLNKSAKQGLTDMGILFTLLKAYDVLDKVKYRYCS